jgi:hypothetical protein
MALDPLTGLPEKPKTAEQKAQEARDIQESAKQLNDFMNTPTISSGRTVGANIIDTQAQFMGLTDNARNYDFNIVRGYNPDQRRADEQPLPEIWVKAAGRVINSAAFSLLDGAGMVYGLGSAVANQDTSKILDNAFLQGLENAKSYVDENLLKVYTPPSLQDGSFWDNITSASFWGNTGADTLGFALAMLVPGQAIKMAKFGKLFAGAEEAAASALSAETKLASLAKEWNLASKFKPGWLVNGVDSAAAVTVNTLYEAGAEARQSYTQLYDELIDKGLTIDEAKKTAGEAASGVFKGNIALLALTNTLFERYVFKGFNANPGKNIISKSIKENGLEGMVDGFKKIGFKEGAKMVGKASIGSFASEGFLEEGTQFAIENFSKRKALRETDKDWIEGIFSTYADNIFTNTDMNLSVFLGGLFGVGMGGVGTVSEIKGANRAIFGSPERSVSKLRKFLSGEGHKSIPGLKDLYQRDIVSNYKNLTDVLETENYNDKDGKPQTRFVRDANGQLKINRSKMHEMMQTKMNDHGFLEEAVSAIERGDKTAYELATTKATYNAFREILSNPYGELLLNEAIPKMAEKAAPEIQEKFTSGIPVETVQADILKNLNSIKDLVKKAYTKTPSPVILEEGLGDSNSREAFINKINSNKEGIELERQFSKNYKSEFKDEEAFDKAMQDLDDFEELLNNKSKVNDLFKQYLKQENKVDSYDVNDVFTKNNKQYVIIDKKDGKYVISDGVNKLTVDNLDSYEYMTTVSETLTNEEKSTRENNIKELPDVKSVLKYYEDNKTGEKIDDLKLANQLFKKLNEFNLSEEDILNIITNSTPSPLINELIRSIKKPEVPNLPVNNEISDLRGRVTEDVFMPASMDTRKPPVSTAVPNKLTKALVESIKEPVLIHHNGRIDPTTRLQDNRGEVILDDNSVAEKADITKIVTVTGKVLFDKSSTGATSSSDQANYNDALRASIFFKENKDNLKDFQLKIVSDTRAIKDGFPGALMGIVTNNNGDIVDNEGSVLTDPYGSKGIRVKIPRADNMNLERFKRANSENPTLLARMQQDHKARLETYNQELALGNDIFIPIVGSSTGTISEIRRQNPKPIREVVDSVNPTIESVNLDDPRQFIYPVGAILVDNVRALSKKLTDNDSTIVANIIFNSLNKGTTLEEAIASNQDYYNTLFNLVFFHHDWENIENGFEADGLYKNASFIKQIGDTITIQKDGKLISLPITASLAEIKEAVSGMRYQIVSENTSYPFTEDGGKLIPYQIKQVNEDGSIGDTLVDTKSYKSYILDNSLMTYEYPTEITNGKLNYQSDNVYPYVSYENIQVLGENIEEDPDTGGEVEDPFAIKTDNKELQQPTQTFKAPSPTIETYLPPAKLGAKNFKSVSKSSTSFVGTAKEGTNTIVVLNEDTIDKAFSNLARNLGAYFEFEPGITSTNYVVTENPIVIQDIAGNWNVVSRGKLSVAPLNRLRSEGTFMLEDNTNARQWLEKQLPGVDLTITDIVEKGVFGYMMNAAIVLDNNAEIGTIYHEGFHAFSQHVLTDSERSDMYNAWRKINTNASNLIVEESLAEEFREYSLNEDSKSPFKKFFDKIIRAIKALIGLTSKERRLIEKTFAELYDGKVRRNARIETSDKYYRKSDDFTNEQIDELSSSLTGYVLRGLLRWANTSSFNIDVSISDKDIDNAFNNLLKAYEGDIITNAFDPVILEKLKRDIKNNKEVIVKDAKMKLKTYDVTPEDEIENEVEEADNKGWDSDDSKHSIIASIPKRIRVILGSMISYRSENGNRIPNYNPSTGSPKFLDAKQSFSILANLLAGTNNLQDMLIILNENATRLAAYEGLDFLRGGKDSNGQPTTFLEKYLGYNPITNKLTVNARTESIQTEFLNAFANQEYKFNIYFASEDRLTYINSTQSRLRREARVQWRSSFIANKDTNAVLKDGKWLHNMDVHKDLQDIPFMDLEEENWLDYLDYMEFLGLKMPIFYDDNDNAIEFNIIKAVVGKDNLKMLQDKLKVISTFLTNHPDVNNNIHDMSYEESKLVNRSVTALMDMYNNFRSVAKENQFMDLNNNTRYTVGRHSYLSKQVTEINKALTKGPEEANILLTDIFYGEGSSVKSRMLNGDIKSISMETSTGIKDTSIGSANEFDDSALLDKLAIFFKNILDNRYTLIRPADNKQERVFTLLDSAGKPVSIVSDFDTQVWTHFKNAVKTRNTYDKYNKVKDLDIHFFNWLPEDIRSKFINEAEVISENEAEYKQLFINSLNEYVAESTTELINDLVEANALFRVKDKYINNVFDSFKDKITIGRNEEGDKKLYSEEQISSLAKEIVEKQMVSVLEQMKMFAGDPAFYGNVDKLLKRTSGWVGPKSTSRFDKPFNDFLNKSHKRSDGKLQDGSIRVALFKDPIATYPFAKGEHEEADAVAYINLDFQREFSLRNSAWTFKQEITYLDAKGLSIPSNFRYETEYKAYLRSVGRDDKLLKIYKEDIGTDGFIIQPLKPQYFGKFGTDTPGMIKTAFVNVELIKKSILPISDYMSKHSLDMVTFPTAVKIGGVKELPSLFEEVDGKAVITTKDPEVITAHHQYIGVQVTNAAKHKHKASSGSQQAKIFLDYLFNEGTAEDYTINITSVENGESVNTQMSVADVQKEFVDTHNAIHSILYDNLLFELGIFKENGEFVISNKESNFIDSLRSQATERGMSSNIINMIDDIDKYGLETTNEKLQNVLLKMVDTAIVNAKVTGNGYYQHTATLARKEDTYTFNGKTFSSSDLAYYSKNEDGSVNAMEVYLPWYMESEAPDINKLAKESLEAYGFRIPTQDLNSLDALVIKGFLPKTAGNMVMVPVEYFKKNGSDSDGDKLFIHLPALNSNNKVVDITTIDKPTFDNKLKIIRKNKLAYEEAAKDLKNLSSIKGQLASIMNNNMPLNSKEAFANYFAKELLAEQTSKQLKEELSIVYDKINSIFDKYNLIEEFNNIKNANPLSLQSVAALQNKRMMIARGTVLNPKNFDKLVQPLDAKYYEKLFDEVNEIRGVSKLEFHSLFDPVKLMNITEEYMIGKSGIGVAANHRSNHPLALIHNIQLTTKTDFIGLPAGTHSLAKQKNQDGVFVSALLSDTVNIFVDAVSKPMIKTLNLGTDTINVALTLIRLGVPLDTVVYYLNQPIIVDFLQRRSSMESALLRGQKMGESKTNTYFKILQKYGLKHKNTKHSITKLSKDYLRKGVNRNHSLGKDTELALLQSFVGYYDKETKRFYNGWLSEAKSVSSYMKSTSQDRTSPGKNLAEFLSKYYMGISENRDIVNMDKMLDSNTFLGRYLEQYNDIKDVFAKFFMFATPANLHFSGRIINELYIKGTSQDTVVDYLNKFYNHAITYLLQSRGLEAKRQYLLYGDNSIAHRLNDMKSKYPSNPFLKSLTPALQPDPTRVSNGEILSGILHTREKSTSAEEEILIDGFEQLLESSDIITQEFAKDLVDSVFLTTGYGNTPIGFAHLIPSSYLKQLFDQYNININQEIPYDYLQAFDKVFSKDILGDYLFESTSEIVSENQPNNYEKGLSEIRLTGIPNMIVANEAETAEDPNDILRANPVKVFKDIVNPTVETTTESSVLDILNEIDQCN